MIIIEVYGRNDVDYLKRKEMKGRILESQKDVYFYIPWNAYLKENLPRQEIKSKIFEILIELGR